MGKKLLLKFLGVMLIVIGPFSQTLHAGVITDDKFIDFFNLKMSTSVITLLCTDEDFINDLGLTKEIVTIQHKNFLTGFFQEFRCANVFRDNPQYSKFTQR